MAEHQNDNDDATGSVGDEWGQASWDTRDSLPLLGADRDRGQCGFCDGYGCEECCGTGVELTREDFLRIASGSR